MQLFLRRRLPTPAALAVCLGLLAASPAGAAAAGPSPLEPSFEYPTSTAGIADSEIWGMDSGDLNNDGRADIVTANSNTNAGPASVGVQLAAADGTFAEPVAYPLPSNGALFVTLGDFDGDLDLDLVALRDSGTSLLLNDGNGGFGTELPVAEASASMFSAAAGDFNRDGDLDLAISDGPEARIFLGAGDGSFAEGTPVGYEEESWGNTIVVADFEGDGSADLGATQFDSGQTEILSSDDDGTFSSRGGYGTPCGCAWGLAAADFDLDGDEDLVVTERASERFYSLMAGPNHTFTKGADASFPAGSPEQDPIWIAAGDMNGDGYPDVATSDYLNNSVTSFPGDGSGNFVFGETIYPPEPAAGPFGPHANVIDDFNDDGRLDLAAGSQLGPVADYVNDGYPIALPEPTSLSFAPQPAGTTSTPLTVHLENEGRATLRLATATLAGANAGAFTVDASDCMVQPALVGVGCDVGVSFEPSAVGSSSAFLELEYNRAGPSGELKVALSGSGTPPTPEISRDLASIEFGNQLLDTSSGPRTITIGNNGSAPLQLSGIALFCAGAADFELDPATCAAASIPVAGECEFTVAFKPAALGPRQAEVVISSNDPSGEVGTALAGNGTATTPAPTPTPTPGPVAPTAAPIVGYSKVPSPKLEISGKVRKRLRFTFSSDQLGSTFQCSLDRRAFSSCRSPLILKNVALGRHRLRVRAINATGTVGAIATTKFRLVQKR